MAKNTNQDTMSIGRDEVGTLTVEPDGTPRIVEAVGISANVHGPNGKQIGKALEAAMSDAVLAAAKAGIADPVKIKAAMMMAREKVLQRFRDAEAAALAQAEKDARGGGVQ